MFRVPTDKGLEKSRLANARGTNESDNNRGCFLRQSIDERDMETFLFDLEVVSTSPERAHMRLESYIL